MSQGKAKEGKGVEKKGGSKTEREEVKVKGEVKKQKKKGKGKK